MWNACYRNARTLKKNISFEMFFFNKCWRIPIVPERRHSSIVGTTELNFCVRKGNRWTLCVKNTNYGMQHLQSRVTIFTSVSGEYHLTAGIMHLQGFEPGTHWLRVSCSTNWAKGAGLCNQVFKTTMCIENQINLTPKSSTTILDLNRTL